MKTSADLEDISIGGIGKRLRQKSSETVRSANRRIPPFKIKAHKVNYYQDSSKNVYLI